MRETEKFSVFYDGECPLCVLEIGFYRRRNGAEKVKWIDVSQIETQEVSKGLTKCDALARLHVYDQHGALFSGANAFIKIWETLPGFRFLATVARLPFVPQVLETLYLGFLKFRPQMQRMALFVFRGKAG